MGSKCWEGYNFNFGVIYLTLFETETLNFFDCFVGLITALRQQVLDSRLTLERSRQNHEDDINLYKKKEVDHEKLKKELYDQIDELKNEIYKLKIALDNLQITLNKAEYVKLNEYFFPVILVMCSSLCKINF